MEGRIDESYRGPDLGRVAGDGYLARSVVENSSMVEIKVRVKWFNSAD
jgi:hypothetical protein